ncbi:hypothetical protein [Actinomadura sp. SCN-SB]|uniref:hypothetical protein n=1 Tax=Actinomadura sp. SCN-SB TaxID=3373092 RepID=UPI0037537355
MQCPTCGTNTPGTLGTCTSCNAPIHQPSSLMGAPPPEAAPSPQDGERTMVVPMSAPIAAPAEPRPQGDGAAGFNPVEPPPPPAWATGEVTPVEDKPKDEENKEPIVPESWFARPRKTDEQRAQEDQATQQWQAPPPPVAPGQDWGTGAQGHTVLDSAYADNGATQLDQPPMNMGRPPTGPMGPAGPMGPMDPSLGPAMPMGGPMGPPMGPQGPGGPPMGPDGMQGAYYAQPPAPSNQASKPLLIAVSALVTIAVVAVALVAWPGGDDKPAATSPPSTSPSNDNTPVAQKQPLSSPAKVQAIQVNKVLNSSADTRRVLARSIAATSKCQTLPTAIKGFQVVAQRRSAQITQTNRLKVDKLRNGAQMQSTLREAFQASLEADLRLLAWANKAKRGCRGKPRPDVARAPGRTDAERRATLAKKRFVAQWNPVARQAGLPSRAWNGL